MTAFDDAFDGAFDELRSVLHADGADVVVTSRSGDTVVLRLVLETAGCEECVMPRAHLERVATDVFQHADAGVVHVTVDDPREMRLG